MKKKQLFLLVVMACFLVFVSCTSKETRAENKPQLTVRTMEITGTIAKWRNAYIIRGQKPAEIFTIINADPQQLNKLVKSEQTVLLHVRIVSGDNVAIETIDGEEYMQATAPSN